MRSWRSWWAPTVTNEQTYDMKFGEAMWGENSLGARLLKKAPMSLASGAMEAYIGDLAGAGTRKSLPGNMLAQSIANLL